MSLDTRSWMTGKSASATTSDSRQRNLRSLSRKSAKSSTSCASSRAIVVMERWTWTATMGETTEGTSLRTEEMTMAHAVGTKATDSEMVSATQKTPPAIRTRGTIWVPTRRVEKTIEVAVTSSTTETSMVRALANGSATGTTLQTPSTEGTIVATGTHRGTMSLTARIQISTEGTRETTKGKTSETTEGVVAEIAAVASHQRVQVLRVTKDIIDRVTKDKTRDAWTNAVRMSAARMTVTTT